MITSNEECESDIARCKRIRDGLKVIGIGYVFDAERSAFRFD